jgi:hypothetical protein
MVATGVLASYEYAEVDSRTMSSAALCQNLKFLLVVLPPILVIAATACARSVKYVQKNFHDQQHSFILEDLSRSA